MIKFHRLLAGFSAQNIFLGIIFCSLAGCTSTATGAQNLPASVPPTGTATSLATASPTATATLLLPTPTATNTLVAPSPTPVELTATNTPAATLTPTMVAPTPTPTEMVTATSTNTPAANPTTVENVSTISNTSKDGLQVYQEQYCGLCHQLDAAGTLGRFGPTHNGVATTAQEHLSSANYSGNATTPAGYIRESILTPEIYIVDGFAITSHKMPAYTHLSDEEVDALVQFLLEQK